MRRARPFALFVHRRNIVRQLPRCDTMRPMARSLLRQAKLPSTRHVDWRPRLLIAALLLAVAGLYQWGSVTQAAGQSSAPPAARRVEQLRPGVVASMESPLFSYSPGWTVTAAGADPAEPPDPATMPAGELSFQFQGRELALLTAVGDYWSYLYITVDGQPAALLPDSRFHQPEVAPRAGYAPLLAPEAVDAAGAPTARWLRVHWHGLDWSETDLHTVRIELWRGWGQLPLRAVGVDVPVSGAGPRWPAMALLVAAFWLSSASWLPLLRRTATAFAHRRSPLAPLAVRLLGERARRVAVWGSGAGLLLLALAVWSANGGPGLGLLEWAVGLAGLGLLAGAGLVWPVLWYGALFAALPLYYRFALPLLPGRAFNLVDAGVFGGLLLVTVHTALAVWIGRVGRARMAPGPVALLLLVASWALVSLFGASHYDVALREFRTVFAMGAALALGLLLLLRTSRDARTDIGILVVAWVGGAALLAGLSAMLYPRPAVTLPAEGVVRLRGPYGSPNNLALYLDRALAVALAVAIAGRGALMRTGAVLASALIAAALVLTFSKGTLFIALPLTLVAVAAGAWLVLRRQGRSTQVVWLLGALALVVAIALLPFVTTERLQTLFSLSAGTGFLRLNLWRSALQMAWEHNTVGVGPDNFLYAYRSGYILPQAWMEPNLNHPHNFVLDWWTRLGLPGLLLGLSFWGVLLAALLRRLLYAQAPRENWPALYLGLVVSVIAALAHGLIDASYALPDLMAIWALLAVLASVESAQSLPQA